MTCRECRRRRVDRRGLCRTCAASSVCAYCDRPAANGSLCYMHEKRKARGRPMWPDKDEPRHQDRSRDQKGRFR